jgi:hypothetical protein
MIPEVEGKEKRHATLGPAWKKGTRTFMLKKGTRTFMPNVRVEMEKGDASLYANVGLEVRR